MRIRFACGCSFDILPNLVRIQALTSQTRLGYKGARGKLRPLGAVMGLDMALLPLYGASHLRDGEEVGVDDQ